MSAPATAPLVYGSCPDTRWLEEEQTLDFIAHLSRNMHRAAGTVKDYTSAVSTKHELLGLDSPQVECAV